MSSDRGHILTFPVRPGCPLWLLVEWAQVFRQGLRSRSKVLLEMRRSGAREESERWFVLVRFRLSHVPLENSLPSALRAACKQVRAPGIDRWTIARVFGRMKSRSQSVWNVALARWGGAAVFVRMSVKDPSVGRLTSFNVLNDRPWKWTAPLSTSYPESLRKEYLQQWRRSQAGFAAPRH